jgi:hypothetical protein
MISKNMKQAVQQRKDLQHVSICLRRMLAQYDDISIYYDVIFRRIQYAELIDGVSVQLCIEKNNVDLSLNEHGLSACRDILAGYMSDTDIDDYIGFIRSQNAIISNQNMQLGILRNCNVCQLKAMLNESESYFKGANVEMISALISEELKARSLLGRIRTAAMNFGYRVKIFTQFIDCAHVLHS